MELLFSAGMRLLFAQFLLAVAVCDPCEERILPAGPADEQGEVEERSVRCCGLLTEFVLDGVTVDSSSTPEELCASAQPVLLNPTTRRLLPVFTMAGICILGGGALGALVVGLLWWGYGWTCEAPTVPIVLPGAPSWTAMRQFFHARTGGADVSGSPPAYAQNQRVGYLPPPPRCPGATIPPLFRATSDYPRSFSYPRMPGVVRFAGPPPAYVADGDHDNFLEVGAAGGFVSLPTIDGEPSDRPATLYRLAHSVPSSSTSGSGFVGFLDL